MSPAPRSVLDVRRDEALAVFGAKIRVDSLGATRVRRRRDRITLDFPDGTEALIHVASYKGGLGVGAFNLAPALIIYGGPVRQVIDELGIPIGSAFSGGKLVVALLDAVGRRSDSFPFLRTTGVERQATRMTQAIQDGLVPLITAFTGDYERAVGFVAAEPARVASPWCSTLTLLTLAGDDAKFREVSQQAHTDPDRWPDLAGINDPSATAREIQRLVSRGRQRDG